MEYNYKIKKIIAKINNINKKSPWIKVVMVVSWDNRPDTIDFRSVHINENNEIDMVGRGISFKPDEIDTVITELLKNNYGDLTLYKDLMENKVKEINSFTFDND